jgi:hypothetical protein
LAEAAKRRILSAYKALKEPFERYEEEILRFPLAAFEEKTVIEGKTIHTYRRCFFTGAFSGNIIGSNMYISLSYVIDKEGQQIIVVGVYFNHLPI